MRQLRRSIYRTAVCTSVLIALQPVTGRAETPDVDSPYNLPAQEAAHNHGASPGNPQAPYPPGYRQPNYGAHYGYRGYPYPGSRAQPGYGRPVSAPPYSSQDIQPPAYDRTGAAVPPALPKATPGESAWAVPTPPAMPAVTAQTQPSLSAPAVAAPAMAEPVAAATEAGDAATAVEPAESTLAPMIAPDKEQSLLEKAKTKVEAIPNPDETTAPETK